MNLTTEGGDLCACRCGRTVVQAATGRRRRYFEDACKSRAKRWRAGAPARARQDALQAEARESLAKQGAAADELVGRIPEELFRDLVAGWATVAGGVTRRARKAGLLEDGPPQWGRLPYSRG